MKHILLILLAIPLFSEAQSRRGSYIGQEYDSSTNTYWFIRKDFPPSMTTRQYFYGVRGMQSFIIFPDTLRLWNYRGKNHGTIDTLLWITQGVVRQSPADQLDVSKLGGSWPVSRLSGTLTKAQLPALGFSDLTGTYTGSVATSQLTGSIAATTVPYTGVSSGRLPTTVTRSFNSAFTPSATRDVLATYTVTIQMPLTLLGIIYGQVFLEISPNGTTWTSVGVLSNGNSAIVGSGAVSAQLSFLIPAGYQVRLRSVVQGSVTITYNNGFETAI